MARSFAALALCGVLLLQANALVSANARCEDDNCAVCNARHGTPCYECQPGYKLVDENGNKYCACEDPNCNLCTQDGACTQCFVGFGLGGDGLTCEACADPNCSSCNDDYETCDECAEGFTLSNSTNSSCVACPEGCSSCSSEGECSECGNGYSLTQDGQCTPCADPNCRACASPDTCDECAPTYGNVEGSCQQCTDGACLQCDGDASVCTSCRGNRLVAKDGVCVSGDSRRLRFI